MTVFSPIKKNGRYHGCAGKAPASPAHQCHLQTCIRQAGTARCTCQTHVFLLAASGTESVRSAGLLPRLRFALDETKILYHKTPRGAICKISEKMFPFCRETGKNAGKQPRTQAKRAACGGPFCLEGWESIKRLGILFDTTSLQHSASLSNAEKRFFISFVIYTRLIS